MSQNVHFKNLAAFAYGLQIITYKDSQLWNELPVDKHGKHTNTNCEWCRQYVLNFGYQINFCEFILVIFSLFINIFYILDDLNWQC